MRQGLGPAELYMYEQLVEERERRDVLHQIRHFTDEWRGTSKMDINAGSAE